MSEEDLSELRNQIDELDQKLINLLSQRFETVDEILEIKKEMGEDIRDRGREQEVIEKARDLAREKGLDPLFVEDFLRLIISRSAGMEQEKVAEYGMWDQIKKDFAGNPAQLKVARVLYKYGFRVNEEEEVVCGGIRIPAVQVAQEAGVDRRAVNSTAETILENEDLREIFANLRPIPYLKGAARQLDLGVIEILSTDPTQSGVISEVTDVISGHGLTVRQSVADDPYFAAQPKLTIITDEAVSGEVIEELRELPSVESVIVY